ncbi:MAG: hypothetical protein AAGG11_07230 [Pseudomonadota bacterium]
MMIPLQAWAALFIVPALLAILLGNSGAAVLVVVMGAIFMLGYWVGSTAAGAKSD